MLQLFKKKPEQLLGLDIGSANVRLIYLREKGQRTYSLDAFGVLPLSPETIVEGSIIDPSAVVDTLGHLVTQLQVKERRVAFSISGNAVFVKTLRVGSVEDPYEMRESIFWEAEQFLPFPRDEVMLDYHIIGDPATQPQVDVVVVALKRDVAQMYLDTLRQANLEPICLDIDAFAVQNAFELNYPDEVRGNTVIMLINIGASKTNINIMKGGEPLLVRDAMVGVRALTDLVRAEFNLTYDQAELAKRGRYEIRPEQLKPYINQVLQDIGRELQKTYRFFQSSYPDSPVKKIYISGGGSQTLGLKDYLAQVTQVPVEMMDPFRVLDTSAVDPGLLDEHRYASAVTVGLGIRKA